MCGKGAVCAELPVLAGLCRGTSTQTAARPRQGAWEQLFLLSSHQLLLSPPPINLCWAARPVPHGSSVVRRHKGQPAALNLSGLPVAALTATAEQGRRCLQTRETTDQERYGYALITQAEGNPGSVAPLLPSGSRGLRGLALLWFPKATAELNCS